MANLISQITPIGQTTDYGFRASAVQYGTSSTGAGTAEKAVTCASFTSNYLIEGSIVAVKFSATNTAATSSLALNVNSTGAKPIKYIYNGNLSDLPSVSYLKQNQIYLFYYDGTNWVVLLNYDTNDVSSLEVINSNPTLAWNTKSAVGSVDGTELEVTMPAQPVTQIKGNAETNYRTGQVNLTPANLGISATTTSVTVGSITFNKYSHPTGDGNLHVPATGTSNNGKVLKAGSTAGSISWGTLSKSDVGLGNVANTTITVTSTSVSDGSNTFKKYTHPTGDGNLHVPATGTSNNGKVLKAGSTAGSLSWGTLSKSDVGLGNVANTTITVTSTSVSDGTNTFNKYTHPTTSGNKHIPSGGSSGQFLGWSADGTAKWVNNPNVDTKVNVVARGTTKSYLMADTTSPTSTAGAHTAVAETGIYMTTTAGQLNATTFKVNEAVTLQYNATTKSLDFIFA